MRASRVGPIFAAVLTSSALAQPENITAGELALTPPVCQDVQGIGVTGWTQHFRHSPRAPYWEGIMGSTFWAMHHYCWALVHLQRAKRSGVAPQLRAHMIRTAISDYYYVIKNAKPDFVLLPEIYYRAGEARVQLGEFADAVIEFEKSRAAKADYWPPYIAHAQILERLGKRREALEQIESALRLMPAEPNLNAAYVRLGGTPQPVRPAASAAAAASIESQPAPTR